MSTTYEIERKFLINSFVWIDYASKSYLITQAYLSSGPGPVVRVRKYDHGTYLDIKTPTESPLTRTELSFFLTADEARTIWEAIPEYQIITKLRHEVKFSGKKWEIDVFTGKLTGLVIAEVELNSADEEITLPPWINQEITDLPYFQNCFLGGKTFEDIQNFFNPVPKSDQ